MIGGWTVRVTSREKGSDVTRFYHAAVQDRAGAEQAVRERLADMASAHVVAVASVPDNMIQTEGLRSGDVKLWG